MKAKDGCESHCVVERGSLFDGAPFVVVGPSGHESQGFRDRATAERWARKLRAEYARRHAPADGAAAVAAATARVRRRRGGVR